MALSIKNLSWIIEQNVVLNRLNFTVNTGEFVGIIGSNGSGKSSLLRSVFRSLKPTDGYIELNGRNIWELTINETARELSVVLQERYSPFDLTVYDVVYMGRTPHKKILSKLNGQDQSIVEDAIKQVGLSTFSHRNIRTLSGGEIQRVLIARSLAQQANTLLLDEPTNHLDIRYQLEILNLVKKLNVTAIAALHDLNLAAMFCDRVILLKSGTIIADGFPCDVLNPENIKKAFGVDSFVGQNKLNNQLQITYLTPH